MSATLTEELILTLTILLIGMVALAALSTCVSRANLNHLYALKSRFVFNEAPKLPECPITQPCALTFSNRYSLADMPQVFNSNRSLSAFSLTHDLFTQTMVYIFLIPSLFAGKLRQFALSRARTFLLQVAATVRRFSTSLINLLARINFPVRVCSDINDAKVYSQNVVNLIRARVWNVAHGQQVETAPSVNEVGFAHAGFEKLLLMFSAYKGNLLASCDCPDGNRIFFPRQDTIIKSHRSLRSKPALFSLVELIGVGDFCNTPHDELGGKRVLFPNLFVHKFLQVELPEDLFSPRYFTDYITHVISPRDGFKQRLYLLVGRLQLNLRYQFHRGIIPQKFKYRRFLVSRG